MKKIILTTLIALVFLCAGPVYFCCAGDVLKDSFSYTETDKDEDNATIILAQAYNEPAEEEVVIEEEPEDIPAEEEPEVAAPEEEDEGEGEGEEYIPSKYDAMPAE